MFGLNTATDETWALRIVGSGFGGQPFFHRFRFGNTPFGSYSGEPWPWQSTRTVV